MAFARPFAYNTGTTIPGTEQLGNLSIGAPTSGFTNNPQYWNGPDEELGYVIAQSVSGNTQPTPLSGVTASVGFFRSDDLTEGSFINLSETIAQQSFATAADAKTWLNNNGYWTSYVIVSPTPTPTGTPVAATPTPTGTPASTSTPTPSVTNTQTPTTTPTNTPTPSTTPIPVTGYGYNLVALPYNLPTSGNSIMNASSGQTGTTLINELTITNRGFYFNSLDNIGVDRTSYYSQFTGQSVTITFTQNGDSAIYSGDSQSFKFWSGNTGDPGSPIPGTGFVFGTAINIPPTTGGTVVLIQSATTTWVTGATVYVSVVNNNPSVTPTPTATSVTPTPTPTSGYTSDGWLFYYENNSPVASPPTNNGNTAFIPGVGLGTYNPNYTGGTLNIYFNNNNSAGTSYSSQFSTLDTAGGTMTINQGSSTVIYSGTSSDYQSSGTFIQLIVNRSAQMIQSASTSFVSGSTINVVVS